MTSLTGNKNKQQQVLNPFPDKNITWVTGNQDEWQAPSQFAQWVLTPSGNFLQMKLSKPEMFTRRCFLHMYENAQKLWIQTGRHLTSSGQMGTTLLRMSYDVLRAEKGLSNSAPCPFFMSLLHVKRRCKQKEWLFKRFTFNRQGISYGYSTLKLELGIRPKHLKEDRKEKKKTCCF